MCRLHDDDLRYSMPPGEFAFLKRWLEKRGAIIVVPSDIRVAHQTMGQFARQPGKWGVDEPMPPYDSERQAFEDAQSGKLKPR